MTSNSGEARPNISARAVGATAFAFFATMVGTTLPTALYSIYAADLSFSSLTVTVLFAVYAAGVVAALLLFGRLSDQIGRRPVLLIALACGILSSILFMLPPSLPLLVVARVISGVSAGFMSGAGTAAVIDLFPAANRAVGGMVAVAANAGGLAVGNLLGGVLASVSSMPLVTPYAVHVALSGLATIALWALTPRPVRSGELSLRIQRLRVPADVRGAFVRAVLAAGAGFAVCGVLTSVTALFLADELHIDAHWVPGLLVFLVFAMMALGQMAAARLANERALLAGCAGLVVAALLLLTALGCTVLWPLAAASVVLGLASGFCVNAGLGLTVERVPHHTRGEVSSAFFASLYVLLAVPAIGVGLLAAVVGLRHAGMIFATVVAVLSAAIGAVQTRRVCSAAGAPRSRTARSA